MFNLMHYLQNPNLLIHEEHYADDISLLGSNTKDGFVKTAATLFCRLFWENDTNEGKGQEEIQDIELANTTKIRSMKVFSKDFRHTLNIPQTPLPLNWRHLLMIEVKSANFKL